jgi:hypothetical protein
MVRNWDVIDMRGTTLRFRRELDVRTVTTFAQIFEHGRLPWPALRSSLFPRKIVGFAAFGLPFGLDDSLIRKTRCLRQRALPRSRVIGNFLRTASL